MELNGLLRLDEERELAERATFSADGRLLLVEAGPAVHRLTEESDHGTAGPNRLANVESWLHIWWLDDNTRTEIPLLKLTGEATERNRNSLDGWNSRLAAFSPDARRAVVRSSRNRFRIRDLESQSPLTPPITLEGSLRSAEFSPDGKLLLTSSQCDSDDYVLQLWDAESGDLLSPPLPVCCLSCSFAGHDTVAVYGYEDGQFYRRLLALTPNQRPAQDLVRLAQWLSGRHLDDSGALTALDAEAWQALGALSKPN